MARRKNTVTRFVSDIVDDTKDFGDDLLDRAKDVEEDLRGAVRNAVNDDEETATGTPKVASTADLKALSAAVAELTATVNALAASQGGTGSTRRSTKAA